MVIVKGNIDNLMKDLPVHFHCEQMGLTEIKCHEIIISYYETEELAMAALKKAGFLGNARIIREPNTKQ